MIKFGTSGWRGLIAQDFTFDGVRLASQAIARYLTSELTNPESKIHGRDRVVILGYDRLSPLLCNRERRNPRLLADGGAGRVEKKSLGQILQRLERQTGEFHSERINIAVPSEQKEALLTKLGSGLEKIGSFKVKQFIRTDGFKFLLPDEEWVAFRASGTEPLIRCYIEAKSEASLQKLRRACQNLLKG